MGGDYSSTPNLKSGHGWSITSYRINRKTSNISRTLIGKKIVDHSDVVGTLPVGAAPPTSSFST